MSLRIPHLIASPSEARGAHRLGLAEASSGDSPVFKWMKPRVGSQYQTKVPKFDPNELGESVKRPAPEPMSREMPYVTQKEVTNESEKGQDAFMTLVAQETGSNGCRETARGGLLIHNASNPKESDDYLIYAKHSMLPIGSDETLPPDEVWKQDMIRLYGTAPQRRGRKKRRLDASWDTVAASRQSCDGQEHLAEEDAPMLEYLQTNHGGNAQEAELAIRVQLSTGRAANIRRCIRKELHESRFRRPGNDTSESWKSRFERLFPTMIGDYRTDPSQVIYPFVPSEEAGGDVEMATSEDSFDDDMKGVWRSVLAAGQEMEKALTPPDEGNKESDNHKKLLLSSVLSFLQKAHALPTPESAFGNRHLVVEGISECFNTLFDHVSTARDAEAKIMDLLYDESGEGVDADEVKKLLDEKCASCPLKLDCTDMLRKELDMVADWQTRVDPLASTNADTMDIDDNDNLAAAEELAAEARTFCVRWKYLVLLEKRVEKAHELRKSILQWRASQSQGKKEPVKFVVAMVREANKISLHSAEAWELLQFHRTVELWIDRANIAIRSRLSLSEIESLIERGEAMPVVLSEYLEKLYMRVQSAKEWIEELQEEVPCPRTDGSEIDYVAWMYRIREAAKDDGKRSMHSRLQELSSEGARVPVEITAVNMLQVELDAKSWSARASKWIPPRDPAQDDPSYKKGRLEDLREHAVKGEALCGKFCIGGKERWVLEGLEELTSIIDAADTWFENYTPFLDTSDRRNEARSCLSLQTLKQIVEEGNAIHANIGSGVCKMARVLTQAETWYEKNKNLLMRCGLLPNEAEGEVSCELVSLTEIHDASAAATADISLDLDEAVALKKLIERSQTWFNQAMIAAPMRNTRTGRGKAHAERLTVEDLVQLIEEAKTLPIQTVEHVQRLNEQLKNIHTWRTKAHGDMREISDGFQSLRQAVNQNYGSPGDFYKGGLGEQEVEGEELEASGGASAMDVSSSTGEEAAEPQTVSSFPLDEVVAEAPTESSSQTDSATDVDSAQRSDGVSMDGSDNESADSLDTLGGDGDKVQKRVSSLLGEAKRTGVFTKEEEALDILDRVAKWCFGSFKTIQSPKDVFGKRSYKSFDKMLETGVELSTSKELFTRTLDNADFMHSLVSNWGQVVDDQLVRLQTLQSHRDQFIAWGEEAQRVLTGKDGRFSMEALERFEQQSREYPSNTEMVQRVRNLHQRATNWKKSLDDCLAGDESIPMADAKSLLEDGDKMKITCDALKSLRAAIKSSRGWLAKVRRKKVDQGSTLASEVEGLIDQHDKLLVSMPDEVKKLKQAIKGYCICRRPYEGFMIGCDGCDEWYHGRCIGVSEAQAGRSEKYLCIRCSVKRTFTASSTAVASTIRKWTCEKDLRRLRALDAQKHQRKVRKEKKDIEKLVLELASVKQEQASLLQQAAKVGNEEIPPVQSFDQSSNVAKDDPVPPSVSAASSNDGNVTGEGDVSDQTQTEETTAPNQASSSAQADVHGDLAPCVNETEQGETSSRMTSLESAFAGTDIVLDSPTVKTTVLEEISQGDDASQAPKIPDQPDINSVVPSVSSSEEIEKRLKELELRAEQLATAIQTCNERIERHSQHRADHIAVEQEEDKNKDALRRWCLRLRSLILVPSSSDIAEASRPSPTGSISEPMMSIFRDAEILGIAKMADVHVVANSFKVIAWTARAMETLAKRPVVSDIATLLSESASLSLPDEKAVRMMKNMVRVTSQWQTKAQEALLPMPGERRPISMDLLKRLSEGAAEIPLTAPEVSLVTIAMEDKGCRHCFCGGPTDESFMLACDKCEKWYHGRCVNIEKSVGSTLEHWVCAHCCEDETNTKSELPSVGGETAAAAAMDCSDDSSDSDSDDGYATCAPLISSLWPPFGLLKSPTAIQALGLEVCSFPDDVEPLAEPDSVTLEENDHQPSDLPVETCQSMPATFAASIPPASVLNGLAEIAVQSSVHPITETTLEILASQSTQQGAPSSEVTEKIVAATERNDSAGRRNGESSISVPTNGSKAVTEAGVSTPAPVVGGASLTVKEQAHERDQDMDVEVAEHATKSDDPVKVNEKRVESETTQSMHLDTNAVSGVSNDGAEVMEGVNEDVTGPSHEMSGCKESIESPVSDVVAVASLEKDCEAETLRQAKILSEDEEAPTSGFSQDRLQAREEKVFT